MAKPVLKDILAALGILKAADPEMVKTLQEDDAVTKAVAEATTIMDRWEASRVHAGVIKEEIKTGPEQESSGAGAPKMIKEYSEPTAQRGATLASESFSRILGPMADALKAIAANQSSLQSLVKTLITAKADEEEEDEEDEEDEVVEIKESKKAKKLLAQAKALLVKATDSDEPKAIDKAKIEAAPLLIKAKLLAALSGDETLSKSIADLIAKADINVVQEEEEDEDEEDEEKSKKAKEAADAAAKAGAKNDAAAAAENQDKWAEAAKSVETVRKNMEAVLAGNATLSAKFSDVLQFIQGQAMKASGGGGGVPEVAKAAVSEDAITVAKSAGLLTDEEEVIARDFGNMFKKADDGVIPKDVVKAKLSRAPGAVRAIFANVA